MLRNWLSWRFAVWLSLLFHFGFILQVPFKATSWKCALYLKRFNKWTDTCSIITPKKPWQAFSGHGYGRSCESVDQKRGKRHLEEIGRVVSFWAANEMWWKSHYRLDAFISQCLASRKLKAKPEKTWKKAKFTGLWI